MPSAAIRSYSYDCGAKELSVGFVGGGDYIYLGVSQADFDALTVAPSKGSFVNEVIKPRYAFRRCAVDPDGPRPGTKR